MTESSPVGPKSPYAVSKLGEEMLARLYHQRYGMPVIIFRPFFIIGTGKEGDVCSDFARRIIQAKASGRHDIHVGNLDVVRDFVDVRDAAAAIECMIRQGIPGEVYNIAGGRGHTISDLLHQLAAIAGVEVSPVRDPDLVRPVDEEIKVGDPARIEALGWRRTFSLRDSLEAICAYWEARDQA